MRMANVSKFLLLVMLVEMGWANAAEQPFSSSWTPKPLVDTSVPAVPKAVASKPAPVIQPDAEAMLKPAEPFIAGVEKQLYVQIASGATLVQRLNHLQSVLFGAPKYQDAGQLLAKLAELFPQEAARAHADLQADLSKQFQNQQAAATTPMNKKKVRSAQNAPQIIDTYPSLQNGRPVGATYPMATPVQRQALSTMPTPQPSPPKKKRFWEQDDDWDNSFNDSFFNDHQDTASQSMPLSGQSTQSNGGGSALRSLGSGLAGLSLLAGTLAGSYYLNKKMGNTNNYPNNYNYGPYANNGMTGYPPYGYGNTPYYANPYGYSNYAYPNPYGSPLGTLITPGLINPRGIPGASSGMFSGGTSSGLMQGLLPGLIPGATTLLPGGGYTTTQTYPLY